MDAVTQEPDNADLMNQIAAKIPAKWELFGTQLHIPLSTMEAIKRNNQGNCDLCFLYLFDEWRKIRSRPYTWSTAIEVLYSPSIGEYLQAEKVYSFVTTKANSK